MHVHVHQAALPSPATPVNGTGERREDRHKETSKSGPTDLPSDETDADEQKEMPESWRPTSTRGGASGEWVAGEGP